MFGLFIYILHDSLVFAYTNKVEEISTLFKHRKSQGKQFEIILQIHDTQPVDRLTCL